MGRKVFYPVLKAKLTSSCSDLLPCSPWSQFAAAEPQWYGYAPVMDATHMKTASGDTVSVAAHKAQHHQLKAAEYAKKGYFGYAASPVVASYAAPVATYAAGVHYIGKREAEADSQYFYNNGVYSGVYANGYNGYALPKVNKVVYKTPVVTSPVVSYNGLYNTYAGAHLIGKREAEADSQFINTYAGYPYATGYTGYTGYTGLTGYTAPYTYGNMWNRYYY